MNNESQHPTGVEASSEALGPAVEVMQSATLALPSTPMGPPDVLRHFLNGRNPRTLEAYRRDLAQFAKWLEASSTEHAVSAFLASGSQQAHATALVWLASMARLAPATRARRLAALRSLVDLAGQLGVVPWSLRLRGPKVTKYRDTRGPSIEQLQKVLAACGDDMEGRRNRALVVIIAVLGLRRLEASLLTVGDYDRVGRRIRVFGKGRDGQGEWLTLPPEVADELDLWLCFSRGFGCDESSGEIDPSTALFFSLDGPGRDPLTPGGVYFIVRELGERVKVRLRPHGLRHAAITTVLDESKGNTRMAQSFGRHADPRVTGRYDDNRRDLAGEAAGMVARRLLG